MARMIRIRVGAAIDPSLRTVFKPFEVSAEQAARKVRASFDGATKQTTKSVQTNVTRSVAANKAYADALRMIEKSRADYAIAQQQRSTRAAMRAFDERLRGVKKNAADEERVFQSRVRMHERVAMRGKARNEAAFRDFGGRAVSNVGGLVRGAVGVGREVASGVGVDASIAGTLSRGVNLEQMAVALSNQGVNKAEGKARIDPKAIESRIKQVADDTAIGRDVAGAGLENFIGLTGDLQAGLASMQKLAELAKVTNSSFADMGAAAGEVSNALGDMPAEEKAKAILNVMNSLAAQGKIGAVEISHFAKEFGKIGAAGTRFEGDRAGNLKMMGALIQMSRKYGGAAGASEAGTSIAGMANTFSTPARVAAFKKAGINVFSQKTGLIRDPSELIFEALSKTQGNPTKFKKLFANVIGAKPAEGLASVYRTARASALEGGASKKEANEVGLRAARDELDTFANASIDAAENAESLALALDTTASKAQRLQNKLDDVAQNGLGKLGPSLEKLGEKFAGVANFAVENPGTAVGGAIAAAIAKGGIESAFSALVASSGAAAAALAGIGVVGVAAAAALKFGFDAHDQQVTEGATKTSDRQILLDRYDRAQMKMKRGEMLDAQEARSMVDAPVMLDQVKREREQAKKLDNPVTYWNALFGEGEGWDSLMQKRAFRTRDEQNEEVLRRANGGNMQDPLANLDARLAAAIQGGLAKAKIEVTVNNPTGVDPNGRVGSNATKE